MSGFALGMAVGCLVGVVGTLLLLLAVYSIPDAEYLRSRVSQWGLGLFTILIIAAGGIFSFLNLHRVAFATTVLLLLVFIAAHLKGMLASWISLAVATLALCLILPPVKDLTVADSQDRWLLVFFVLCGLIGTRLVASKQRA